MRLRLLSTIFLPCLLFSQQQGDLLFKIDSIECELDTIIIATSIFNKSADTIRCYRFELEDICYSILKIYAIDSANNKKHEVSPFDFVYDLDEILLTNRNILSLPPKEKYISTLKFLVKDFSPHIKRGYYNIYIEVNYSAGKFKTTLKNVYEFNLQSNTHSLKYNPCKLERRCNGNSR